MPSEERLCAKLSRKIQRRENTHSYWVCLADSIEILLILKNIHPVATIGTTSSGAIDRLDEIGEVGK